MDNLRIVVAALVCLGQVWTTLMIWVFWIVAAMEGPKNVDSHPGFLHQAWNVHGLTWTFGSVIMVALLAHFCRKASKRRVRLLFQALMACGFANSVTAWRLMHRLVIDQKGIGTSNTYECIMPSLACVIWTIAGTIHFCVDGRGEKPTFRSERSDLFASRL